MGPKVLNFEESAEYIYSKAMKYRRENKYTEATELLRQASARAPKEHRYALELADLYTDMGQYILSDRVLLGITAEADAPAESYRALAVNAVLSQNEDGALRALEAYRKRASDADYDDAVDEVYGMLSENAPADGGVSRRKARILQAAARAGKAMSSGNAAGACMLFEKCFKRDKDLSELKAPYAVVLAQSGNEERAIGMAKDILRRPDAEPHELTGAALALWICGRCEEARAAARSAIERRPMGYALTALLPVLAELNMHAELAEQCRLALQETPFDKWLLELRAAALVLSGAPGSEAAACWRRIVRVDPYDAAANYWLDLCAKGKLDQVKPDYDSELPDEACREMQIDLAKQLLIGWPEDAAERFRLRCGIEWAVTHGGPMIGVPAAIALAASESREDINALREYLYRVPVSADVRENIRTALKETGRDPDQLFPPAELVSLAGLPQMNEVLSMLPVYERQMIRFASDILYEHYGISAGAELAEMWLKYVEREGKNRISCMQEGAAALAWNYLLSVNVRPSVGKLTEQFECLPRRMVFYARHIAAALEGCVEDEKDH